MKPLIAFTLFLLTISWSCRQRSTSIDPILKRSVQWMWSQQSEDGGWHSTTHAVLRDGQALTPYILYYLLQVPQEVFTTDSTKMLRAVDFVETQMLNALDDEGSLADYPNYSAAYSLRILHAFKRDTALQKKIAEYLISQQFIEHRGFSKDSLVYGGWGYGETNLPRGRHGHVDISHTRRVAEALAETGYSNSVISEAVLVFLKGVQRVHDDPRSYTGCELRSALPYDGGFVASVVTLATTKSAPVIIEGAGVHYPSYATATCDGLMTMQALGLQTSGMYADAEQWLKRNPNVDRIDGLTTDDSRQWSDIMHYYHLAVRAEAMHLIDLEDKWRKEMQKILEKEQYTEGYFLNPLGAVNKEDDPLMATILCIQTAIFIKS